MLVSEFYLLCSDGSLASPVKYGDKGFVVCDDKRNFRRSDEVVSETCKPVIDSCSLEIDLGIVFFSWSSSSRSNRDGLS